MSSDPRSLRAALFIPCYVDQLRPDVGRATVALLERFGVTVAFPSEQTCCGQPLINSGAGRLAVPLAERFVAIFADHDYVVCPSASCVATVTRLYEGLLPPSPELDRVRSRTREFCDFLTDVLGLDAIDGRFPHRVGLHASCHGLRELRQAAASERMTPAPRDPARTLLASLDGLELVGLRRPDECCGFGGTFAIDESDVSCAMGRDRLADHLRGGAEVLTSSDVSCLLHMEGLARRGGSELRVLHIAELLEAACREE
jgi:L-lactate dehydrogenase complex protein LldE